MGPITAWIPILPRLLAAVLLVAMATTAVADEQAGLGPADRSAIRAVIETQIAAFRRDDGDAAFALASPNIQRMFRTAEIFMTMVRQGYQPVYRPRRIEFRDVVDLDGVPTQEVHVIGPDGLPYFALYLMERQADGSWRIGGVFLVRAKDKET